MKKSINYLKNNRFGAVLRLKSIGLAIAAVLLAGCVSGGTGSRRGLVESTEALDAAYRIYDAGQGIKAITAKGSLRYQEKSRQHFIRFDLAALRPGQLFFAAYGPAGQPALRLYVNGSNLTAIDYFSREIISGPATASNLMAFLPLGLNPDQVIISLAGGQPLDRPVKAAATRGGGKQAGFPPELEVWSQGDDEDNHWRYRLAEGRELEVSGARYGPLKKPILSYQYQNFQDLPGLARRFPHSIIVTAGQGDKSRIITIRYDQVVLAENLAASLFEPPPVEGFKRVDLLDVLGP